MSLQIFANLDSLPTYNMTSCSTFFANELICGNYVDF